MNPDLGRQAAEENRSEIAEALSGADLVFVTAGLGGGTGTGAAPVVAEVAKQSGALTIAVATKPFAFEGSQRERVAREGLVKLKDKVDAIIAVPNDRIFTIISKDTSLVKAFEAIDDVLRGALKGIVDLIAAPGIINVDFADVRNIIQDAGPAVISVGTSHGADRAVNAVNSALNSPLLEGSAEGAKAVLLGISGGRDMKMNEINEAAKAVSQVVDPGARIIFGAYHDKTLRQNHLKVTLIATGFNGGQPHSLFSGNNHFSDKKAQGLGDVKADFGNGDARSGQEQRRPMAAKSDEIPAPKRKEDSSSERSPASKKDGDILDTPTFLRKGKKWFGK